MAKNLVEALGVHGARHMRDAHVWVPYRMKDDPGTVGWFGGFFYRLYNVNSEEFGVVVWDDFDRPIDKTVDRPITVVELSLLVFRDDPERRDVSALGPLPDQRAYHRTRDVLLATEGSLLHGMRVGPPPNVAAFPGPGPALFLPPPAITGPEPPTADAKPCVENANARKKAKTLANDIADEFVCPITQELPVDPVTAEDGKVNLPRPKATFLLDARRGDVCSTPSKSRRSTNAPRSSGGSRRSRPPRPRARRWARSSSRRPRCAT